MKISETQEKARQARNLYYRKWRAANKEKVKELVSEFKGSKIYALDDASDDEQVKSVFENIKL